MSDDTLSYFEIIRIVAYLKEFYNFSEDMPIIKEMWKIASKKLFHEYIKKFSKLVIQFLFMNNFTILKSRSSNAIRHIFPPDMDNYNEFIEFFGMLKKALKIVDIDIEIIKSENIDTLRENFPERYVYFFFKNYKSIFKFLLYWDDSLSRFPKSKMNDLKQFFKDFEIYIHFNDRYMDLIFGEKGIINKEELTVTKFFDNVFDLSNYKRHSIYKWRDEKFFPATVVYDINKSKYRNEIDIEFFKHIKYIKIGKTQKLNKTLLGEIKDNYENNLNRFIPASDSMLGFIFYHTPYLKEDRFNPLQEFEKYLKNNPSDQLTKYNKEINKIKEKLKIPKTLIAIKSLKLKNFKSYSNVKINFQKGINIFYGENGSGKTSIIDAILFALYIDSWQKVHINDFYNLDFKFLNTQVIRVGEEVCEVELELEKGNEIIRIIRKLWKNGKHKIFINNVDIYESIKERVIYKFQQKASEIEKSTVYYFEDIEDGFRSVPIKRGKFFINNSINRSIQNILKQKEHNFSYKLVLEEYEGFFVSIEGIEKDYVNVEDYYQFIEDIQQYFTAYFYIINEEIESKYNHVNCLFNKNDIYSSLFQEFEFIGDYLDSDFSKLHKYILDKFGVDFIDKNFVYEERDKLEKNQNKSLDLIKIYFKDLLPNIDSETFFNFYKSPEYIDKIVTNLEPKFRLYSDYNILEMDSIKYLSINSKTKEVKEKIKFFEDTRDFLFKLFLNKINENLIKLSREYFDKDRFYCFLDEKGIPKINFYEKDEVLPILNLSGGERSKLILIILSFLIKISNKNFFFLIDEPNELLDPNNVNIMKSLFSRLFENRQIIICTFIENYKSFKPALIYHVEKDPSNISFITQISPRRKFKDLNYIFEEEAREFIIPILKKKGYTDIEFGKKIGGYIYDIFATMLTLEGRKKAIGEVILDRGHIPNKIIHFSNWLLSMKGNEYNPDRGDYAFIITQSSTIPKKSMDILEEHNIELFVYKTPKINENILIKAEKYELIDIPGIGSPRVKRLNTAGIYTIRDLLECNSKIIAQKIRGIGVATLDRWKQNAKQIISN